MNFIIMVRMGAVASIFLDERGFPASGQYESETGKGCIDEKKQ